MADVSELFSELSISLFGQPTTATDILTAEIKPQFGEQYLLCRMKNFTHPTQLRRGICRPSQHHVCGHQKIWDVFTVQAPSCQEL